MQFDESIFKAYDIRGIYPEQLNENIARLIGAGLVDYLGCSEVYVGQDMRVTSDSIFDALADGIISAGADVVDLGMVSTDGIYFAVGKFGAEAGIMITASHNPPEYNGFKICKAGAVPLSGTDGLPQIKEFVRRGEMLSAEKRGEIRPKNIDEAYAQHCLSFIDIDKIKPFKIAVDAGNGMAGKTLPTVFKHLPCEVIPMFFELDGTFPNHLASPIEPENTIELRAKVAEDPEISLGAAFDGDADRVFLVDEKGELVGGDMITALVAKRLLEKNQGETVVYALICSRAVPELIEKMGGRAIRSRVGHAIIKPIMKRENAIFGGEHSGHFYLRDNYFADSGLIALLVCLELLSDAGKPLSELISEIDHYYRSGEINSKVDDRDATIAKVRKYYEDKGFDVDDLDGITISADTWWVNLRPSNTEPLIRLNAEAETREKLDEIVEQTLKLIRE
ncbi:MAG TPA: phosphomannomutase/phosphoglucomutase [candidate division Zixibacteria bacterium]|nr:phosphomannomutase/phosphoglucomutase [candidate division Zixibacteria bacterium]